MKIVFWGTPKYAAENLESIIYAGHNVIAVVTQPDRKRGRGKNLSPSAVKQMGLNFDIPVYTTNSISKDDILKKLLFNLNADVYIVVAFGQILPREVLNQPKLGCWNSHASLLPKWRGAAPIQWSIINDDSYTGVCIMAMELGLDTGPVIEQKSTDINDNDNLETLSNRLSKISSELLISSLDKIKHSKGLSEESRLKQLNAINQKKLKGNPSYARQITKDDYVIYWNQKARSIIKRIKGLYPNAYTFYKGKRIKIIEVSLIVDSNRTRGVKLTDNKLIGHSMPGEILEIKKKDGIIIMTNDYPILIKYGQLEGKNKTDGYTLSIQSNLTISNIIGN